MEENTNKVNQQNITGEICWGEKLGQCKFWAYDSVSKHYSCFCSTDCIRKKTDVEKVPIK